MVAALGIALALIVLVIALDRRLAAERRDEARVHETADERPPPR